MTYLGHCDNHIYITPFHPKGVYAEEIDPGWGLKFKEFFILLLPWVPFIFLIYNYIHIFSLKKINTML